MFLCYCSSEEQVCQVWRRALSWLLQLLQQNAQDIGRTNFTFYHSSTSPFSPLLSFSSPFIFLSFPFIHLPILPPSLSFLSLPLSLPRYEYHWADGTTVKKPIKCSAPKYIDYLMTWVQEQLDDENIFPSKIGRVQCVSSAGKVCSNWNSIPPNLPRRSTYMGSSSHSPPHIPSTIASFPGPFPLRGGSWERGYYQY